ncbi:MAG TPA: DNA-processing protein DprA, partial [Mycobacteriales bacterium]|nr:DNA-processing protein DprA [Mycobacteriales bacterium]
RGLVELLAAGSAPRGIRGATAERMERADVAQDLEAADAAGIRFLIPGDPGWPATAIHPLWLASTGGARRVAPPEWLWVRGAGSLEELLGRSVSVIGSRAFSSYGEHVATDLAYGLADRGWTVVSGGAYGIDGAAHRGALTAEGCTVAFLAGGLDAPYPSGHSSLFARVMRSGLLASEWPVRSTPQRHRFLIRNRLIAGVSAGTVVVEAAARSGTSSTASHVRTVGRSLMAVPGPVTSALSAGTNELIRGGARTVTRVEEVVEEIGAIGADLAPRRAGRRDPRDSLDGLARQVLDGVPARRPARPEAIAAEAGVPIGDVLRALPALELQDFVEAVGGGWRLSERLRKRTGGGPETDPAGCS